MPDSVTILHVSDPAVHPPAPAPASSTTRVDWWLCHAGSPMTAGSWYVIALPAGEDLARLGQLGFTNITPGYPASAWPVEVPLPGYVQAASAAGGAVVSPVLAPTPAMVTARAVWSGAAVVLGQVGLDVHAMVLLYAPHEEEPRGVDGAAVLLPSGLWMAPGPNGQVMGNSPSEIAAKLRSS